MKLRLAPLLVPFEYHPSHLAFDRILRPLRLTHLPTGRHYVDAVAHEAGIRPPGGLLQSHPLLTARPLLRSPTVYATPWSLYKQNP